MKYCCMILEKNGTCYHEFQKGKYDGTHWKKDSLLLEDDLLDDLLLYSLFINVIPAYDRWGITEVNEETWNQLLQAAKRAGGEIEAVIDEMNDWVQESFESEEVFTILGI